MMLPYTPLHYLLLEREPRFLPPLGHDERQPERRADRHGQRRRTPSGWLRLADAFLMHDRDIQVRCDDLVVRVVPDPDGERWRRRMAPSAIFSYPLRRSRAMFPSRSNCRGTLRISPGGWRRAQEHVLHHQ